MATASGTPQKRETFYVGGSYVQDDNGNHTFQGQMYVEHLRPNGVIKPLSIIFIHGGTRTGNDWLTKPDGDPGWASFFLSRGYDLYIVDLPFRGRSPWCPGNDQIVAYPAEQIQKMFTACKQYELWPQAKLHTQWPGTGMMGDPLFDKLYASTIQQINSPLIQETASQTAFAALLDRINKPVVLVGHSAGGSIPWLVADIRPHLVKMIVGLEPTGPPFFKVTVVTTLGSPYGICHAPVTYEPPVQDPTKDLKKKVKKAISPGLIDGTLQDDSSLRKLINLVDIPVLVVTAPASYHAQYDWITVEYLRQAGIKKVEHLRLEDEGIFGNGHMMFMETNSDDIAAKIEDWIAKTAKGL
ncbi:Alpha/Beta hydrolase protein [Pseudomassariella vexata]|uniref:Alpha/Beta hydrolase protein n=1 Tax=Pseudomassariella vexata TaxID=1141098 RepID=A0A1Y2DDB9_9PEZI|nr:Alpha/Beta hydrolase protein [Pseudomassariella vexata]ORY57258.1 Alpha/Beta hydrolase protein [Pseudomassariella vexata]